MEIYCEGIAGKYDKRNLSVSKSGEHKYPSKKMFKTFLEKYKDIDATVNISSEANHITDEVTIIVELKYKANQKEK